MQGRCLVLTPTPRSAGPPDPGSWVDRAVNSAGQKLALLRETETPSGDLNSLPRMGVTVGGTRTSLLLPWPCGIGLRLPCRSELLILDYFFLICHFPSPDLSFPIHAVREE